MSRTPPAKRLLKLREAAVYLGRSEWTLRAMKDRGDIRFVQTQPNGSVYFDQRDLDAWIEANKRRETVL